MLPSPVRFPGALTALWLLAAIGLFPAAASAQRELHWDRLDVTARLNADGTLTVAETQVIVFTGDWNGGERRFDIRPRQRLVFDGLSRGGPDGWRPLAENPRLDDVDEYAWANRTTLRWRSRRPDDPPFAAASIPYELRYTLAGILLKEADRYRLDHDFAFPDRQGAIERFNLHLTLDPVWQPLAAVPPAYTAGPLAPGRTFVVDLPLRYTGTTTPSFLDRSRPIAIVAGVWIVAGVTLAAIFWFFAGEQARGRFAPLGRDVDEAWLREHVLSYPAEIVAAAWDEHVSAPEVVTLIARMVADGRLHSVVGTAKAGRKGKGADAAPPMTLRLAVDREALQGYERTLVDKLFFGGRTETSTSAVRAHYRSQGFNPATEIAPELRAAVDAALPAEPAPRRLGAVTLPLFLLAVAVIAAEWLRGYPGAFGVLIGLGVFTWLGWETGAKFRGYLHWGHGAALLCLLPAAAMALGVILYLWWYVEAHDIELTPMTVAGVVAAALACILSSIDALRSRRGPAGIAVRKAFASGRAYFVRELARDRPALRDAWYPWLLAFDLGPRVDAWSTRQASRTTWSGGTIGSSTASTSSGGGEWTGFSGGRSGGGGGGASWQAAAAGMAASVSPPSSSGSGGGSSSGGSSGGGSSGGGGGGGW